MATLTITFPDDDGRKPLELRDDRGDARPGNHHARIHQVINIYGGPDGIWVYRAQADFGDSALAIAYSDEHAERLKFEWEISEKLKKIQGVCIAPCYGLFHGKDPEAGGDVTVIIAAMLGKMLDDQGRLSSYPLQERLKIIRIVGSVHLEGMMPQFDLGGANISRSADPNVLWLADFKGMVPHECPWDGNWHALEDTPELEDFKCESLYEIGLNMAIWKPYLYPTTEVEGQGFLDMSYGTETVTTVTHYDDEEP